MGALCASSAMAQSQVTVYGIVDTGVAYTTNINAAGDSMVKMPSLTGSLPSRIGFRGTEDLGGGLQAIFTLETGFGVDTGTIGQGNRLFGRQAFVGLKSAYGTLMLGRQVNMTFLATAKSDVLGPNLFSISSIDPYLANARSDNTLGYIGNFSGVTVGATYSLGRDASATGGPAATNCAGEVAGNAQACRQVTALLGYDAKGFGVNASYDILHGNVGAANGLTSSADHDERTTLNGYWMLGATKIGGGLIQRKIRATTVNIDSSLYYLGFSYPVESSLTLDGQVARLGTKASANDSTMVVARLTYALSKRTAVYTSLGRMNNGGTAAIALDAGGSVGAGKNQNGLMVGLRHNF
jgi:predicted porin